jgi:hypothetical protein
MTPNTGPWPALPPVKKQRSEVPGLIILLGRSSERLSVYGFVT